MILDTENRLQSDQNLYTINDKQKKCEITFENIHLQCESKSKVELGLGERVQLKTVKESKVVLDNLSGFLPCGLNAILGSSGAGKTSLLNAIAKRISNTQQTKIQGSVKINKVEYSYSDFNNIAGYVMQDDFLLKFQTVRESIQFAADMKLTCSEQEKTIKINKLIKDLNLVNCQHNIIGDELKQGISGGERKRVSIALELIREPQILFLDEPTSGQDSHTSYKLISILKNLAVSQNRTIVFTIHQPSSDIWNLFDRIILLAQGKFIYQGSRSDILDYFQNFGFSCPKYSNPADYLMQQMNSKDQKKIDVMFANYNQILKDQVASHNQENKYFSTTAFPGYSKNDIGAPTHNSLNTIQDDIIHQTSSTQVSGLYKMGKLLKRQYLNIKRNKLLFQARIFQTIIMQLFLGSIFWKVCETEPDQNYAESFRIAQGIFIVCLGIFSGNMNPQVITFLEQKPVFLREEGMRLYAIWQFYLTKLIPEIIQCTLIALLNIVFFYFMLGFKLEINAFLFFTLVYTLQSNIGNAFGVLSGSLFSQAKVGAAFALSFLAPQILFGGLFKNRDDFPSWLGWMQYITPTMYSFNAIVRNQLEDVELKNNPVEFLHLNLDKWFCVIMLCLLFCFYHLIGYFFLVQKRQKLQ